jgi:acyl-CoA thioester hydrolase
MSELDGGFAENAAHRLRLRVYYEDTDAGGIVYHASYLRFMERGRSALLRLLGFNHTDLNAAQGVIFAVRSLSIDFVAPGRLDDALEVETRLTDIGGASFSVAQTVNRGGQILAKAQVVVATLARSGRPTRIPASIREALHTRLFRGEAT